MLAVDSETHLTRPGCQAPRLVCVSLTDSAHRHASLFHRNESYDVVRWALSQELTTANGVYDFAVFCAQWPEFIPMVFEGLIEGQYHDVLIRQKLIDIGEGRYHLVFKKVPGAKKPRKLGYSLEDLTLRHTPMRLEKDNWRLRYAELDHLPVSQWPQGAIDYACKDPEATLAVHYAQEGGINLHDEAAQVRAAWALQLASCWGFHTDNKYVDKVLADIQVEQRKRKRRLIESGIVRLDGSRCIERAKARMREKAAEFKLTDKGAELVRTGECTRDEALEQGYFSLDEESCEATNDPLLVDYATYGSFQLLTSKIRALKADVPIQTRFEVLLKTGRTSSSARTKDGTKTPEPGSAAIQNPPRAEGFRECFVPGKGMVLVSCDYDIAELVSLSQVNYALFGFSHMRDAINAGMDPHTDFAASLLGISYEEAVRRKELEEKEFEFYRQLAKVWNFGAPGGLGDKNFIVYARGQDVHLNIPQVKQYRKAWKRKWPEMPYYFRYINNVLKRNGKDCVRDDGSKYKRGYIQHYMSGRIRGGASYTEACNNLFQGLTADAAKAAMFEVSRYCYAAPSSALYGSRIVNFVHDELILELPEVIANEAARELERVMIREYQKYTPDVKIGAKATLMRRWRKKAKRVEEGGRIIPFEDRKAAA